MDWLNTDKISYSDMIELLNRTHNKRVELESKNNWDAFVNEIPFEDFIFQIYWAMYELILDDLKEQGVNYYDYDLIPTVAEFLTLKDFITEDKKNMRLSIRDFLKKYDCVLISEAVEKFFNNLFKELLI